MKKILILCIVLLVGTNMANAQSGSTTPMAEKKKPKTSKLDAVRIVLTSYKEIKRTNGKWQSWPSKWTTYTSKNRSNPRIRISLLDEDRIIYNLQYIIDGEVIKDFDVVYDADRSVEIRKNWDDEYVNCYVVEGESEDKYVYLQGLSLSQLVKDVESWSKIKDSKIYIWDYIEKNAIVAK